MAQENTEAEAPDSGRSTSGGLGTLILSIAFILGGSLVFLLSSIDLKPKAQTLEIDRFGYGGQKVAKIQLRAMDQAGTPVYEFSEPEAIAQLLLQLTQGPSSAEPGEGGYRIRLLGEREDSIAALYVLPDGRWGDPFPRGQNPKLIATLGELCKADWRKK